MEATWWLTAILEVTGFKSWLRYRGNQKGSPIEIHHEDARNNGKQHLYVFTDAALKQAKVISVKSVALGDGN